MFSSRVWKREGESNISKETYIRTIALTTLVMAGTVALGTALSYDMAMNWVLIISTFVVAIICIFAYELIHDPMISFIAVAGMSVAMGVMIGPAGA